MSERLFTDKLVLGWLEVHGVWSLDSATPATSAFPAHASQCHPSYLYLPRPPKWLVNGGGIHLPFK